jgi:hypothetical protein
MRVQRRVLAVVVLAMLVSLMPSCSGGETSYLRAQIGDLQSQRAALQGEIEDLITANSRLQRCVRELSDVAVDLGEASVYLASPRVNAIATSPYSGRSGRVVLNARTIRHLKSTVADSNRAVKHEDRAQTQAVLTSLADGPTAICNDGTKSYSQHASGTCSWHGGVRRWVNYPGN